MSGAWSPTASAAHERHVEGRKRQKTAKTASAPASRPETPEAVSQLSTPVLRARCLLGRDRAEVKACAQELILRGVMLPPALMTFASR